jgi:hypothetical protein
VLKGWFSRSCSGEELSPKGYMGGASKAVIRSLGTWGPQLLPLPHGSLDPDVSGFVTPHTPMAHFLPTGPKQRGQLVIA